MRNWENEKHFVELRKGLCISYYEISSSSSSGKLQTTRAPMFFQFSFFLFDRAWDASLEHHLHTSGSVAAPHNQRPFYSNAHPWRNPSQKELWCQFLHWQQPKQSRMRGPLHLSSFLIIWTARLSLAVSLFTVSLFLNSTNLQLLLLSLLPYPPTHTHPASPVLWASVRSHCTKMKSLTAEDVDWCKANRGKKVYHLAENALDTNWLTDVDSLSPVRPV